MLALGAIVVSCRTDSDTLFTRLDADDTGVAFNNFVEEDADNNVLGYGYFYNGGGVAAGDFNNDGLVDLYFTGNMVADKLYLNTTEKGEGITFEDITEAAGIKHSGWKTGVSVVDINNDGWLDIYVSRSGAEDPNLRRNLLYINQRKGRNEVRFVEKAAEYGLDDPSYTTQTAFFDYDKDGDLDCFLLNHSVQEYAGFSNLIAQYREQTDTRYGSKLMRNDAGRFVDVSREMGLINNVLSFGLGLNVTDLNNDGWLDLYVSNDYNENDYLYINQQGKGFKESIREAMGHTSLYSMGTDAADVNNDGWMDIVTLDMLPAQNERIKLTAGDDNYDKYQSLIRAGFHQQTMRNMLQLNTGLPTSPQLGGRVGFSEIGQLAGISNTDWSWSALFADFDNDGFSDLFITNGYARDYTNMEFLKYSADLQTEIRQTGKNPETMDVIAKMPPINEPNYIFKNKGFTEYGTWAGGFDNKIKEWGFEQASQSNGAVYADLDNDGDLDLVTNNVSEKAFIYQNNGQQKNPQNYLQVVLKAPNEALKVGTRVRVYSKKMVQTQEFQPVRGFQSAMYVPLHFGLGKTTEIDSLTVTWADGRIRSVKAAQTNQRMITDYADAILHTSGLSPFPSQQTLLTPVSSSLFTHSIPLVNDFKIQTLLPQMLSGVGPCMAKGDVNGDGREDVYIGGGRGQAGGLFVQTAAGFVNSSQSDFQKDAAFEDASAVLFDADGDADLDLAVVSGGYALSPEDSLLQPRLYFNQKGKFVRINPPDGSKPSDGLKSPQPYDSSRLSDDLSKLRVNASVVVAADVDADGDQDLFIGAHCLPRRYPEAQKSVLMQNDGKGNFSLMRTFSHSSLVMGASFSDINGDKKPDLLLVGEWMKPTVYLNQNGKWSEYQEATKSLNTQLSYALTKADLDNDGDDDFVIGNMGLNTQYHVTSGDQLKLYFNDFSGNGAMLPLVAIKENGKEYPYAGRDELLDQIPALKKKYSSYVTYANATLPEMLGDDLLKSARQSDAQELRTGILWNEQGQFVFKPLPIEAQYAPVYAIEVADINKDGKLDVILGGNLDRTRVRLGKIDASKGQVLLNTGNHGFRYASQEKSGLNIEGEVRSIRAVGPYLLFGINRQSVQTYRLP